MIAQIRSSTALTESPTRRNGRLSSHTNGVQDQEEQSERPRYDEYVFG